jgi:hypothetical protein
MSVSSPRAQALWLRMMAECYQPADGDYPHVGGMGVTVCAAWQTLEGFLAWATTHQYADTRWLIRDALHAPFAPDNCRWVSGRDYRAYRERMRVYEAFGERKCLASWLDDPRRRATSRQVALRLQRGWPMERALGESPQPSKPRSGYTASQIPVGARFGRLTIIGPCVRLVYRVGSYAYRYDCVCDCGVRKNVNGANLLTGDIVSCGCFRKEATGAQSRTFNIKNREAPDYRLYHLWAGMISICSSAGNPRYPSLGGVGIGVCVAWTRNFTAFRDWALQHGYTGTEYLHRHDRAGDFTPENCAWRPGPQRTVSPTRPTAPVR